MLACTALEEEVIVFCILTGRSDPQQGGKLVSGSK
jgi:hypothetical protein